MARNGGTDQISRPTSAKFPDHGFSFRLEHCRCLCSELNRTSGFVRHLVYPWCLRYEFRTLVVLYLIDDCYHISPTDVMLGRNTSPSSIP